MLHFAGAPWPEGRGYPRRRGATGAQRPLWRRYDRRGGRGVNPLPPPGYPMGGAERRARGEARRAKGGTVPSVGRGTNLWYVIAFYRTVFATDSSGRGNERTVTCR